jgi:Zn-finger nucleic acid-binding protein
VNCPGCGGALRFDEGRHSLLCDFCKTERFVEHDVEGVRVFGERSAQSCPVCEIPLVRAAMGDTRFLYCERCRGMLVPMGAFMRLVEDLRAQQHASRPLPALDPRDLERHLHCPACGGPMDTHRYLGPGNIVIDSCSECELNWLDRGEIERVVRAPDSGPPE